MRWQVGKFSRGSRGSIGRQHSRLSVGNAGAACPGLRTCLSVALVYLGWVPTGRYLKVTAAQTRY